MSAQIASAHRYLLRYEHKGKDEWINIGPIKISKMKITM